MNPEKLGERIRFFRKKAGYTQEKLAELTDKSNHHIAQIEGGKNLPSVPMLYDISCILQVPIDCFFMDDDRMFTEYAAVRFEHVLDRFSDEQLISYVEIQQAIHGVLHKEIKEPDLWEKELEGSSKIKNE